MLGDYVIESGSKTTGNYIKWASGRLEMFGKVDFSGVNINNRGSTSIHMYNSVAYRINFPIASLTRGFVTMTNYSNTGAYVTGTTGGDGCMTNVQFWFYLPVSATNTTQHVHWKFTGTWK